MEQTLGREVVDSRALRRFDLFLVVTAATVLVVRAYLTATGFPQVGGSLHIAHVLPGGLLLAIGLTIASTSVGSVGKAWASLVGGIGFGLFVDEIGKFLTRDNDYFYRPTFAVMYGVLVVIYVVGREVISRRPPTERHVRAVAAQAVADAALGELSPVRRDEVVATLARHTTPETVARYEGLLDHGAPSRRFSPDDTFAVVLRESRGVVAWLAARRLVRGLIWAYLAIQVLGGAIGTAAVIFVSLSSDPEAATAISDTDKVEILALSAQGIPLAIGLLLLLLRRRTAGLKFLRAGLFISLTFTLVIEFGQQQLGALTQFAISMVVYAVVGVLLRSRVAGEDLRPGAPPRSS